MMKKFALFMILIVIIIFGLIIWIKGTLHEMGGTETANTLSPFIYSFNSEGELQESGSMSKSSSPYWWLNSGGVMNIKEGSGSTNQGALQPLSRWRILYNISNPTDTDDGFRPQNIFRLVTKSAWQNFTEEAEFKINNISESDSPNRNISNGILFFLRYKDGNNLYYAGLRVDGTAVIKKKINGEYFTLAQEVVFEGEYHRSKNPNLLPVNKWIGLKTQIQNNPDQSVSIFLFIKEEGMPNWQKVLDAKDDLGGFDGVPMIAKGFAGIRTDFMDVEFKDFKIADL